jgi:hypothetical protein
MPRLTQLVTKRSRHHSRLLVKGLHMRTVIAFIVISLCTCTAVAAQNRKKKAPPRSRTTGQPPVAPATKPRIIGSTVVIITKNGDRLTGEVLDLTAYSVRLRADNLESTIALDTIASISFSGATAPAARVDQAVGPARAEFARDAETALGFFQTMSSSLKPGVDYTEYGRQLSELRRAGERLIAKYGSTENAAEARVVSLMAGALTDYTWARAIWTLKFGRSSDGTVAETDSPVVADAVTLYPNLKALAAAGNRLSAEKLLLGIWRKASEKQDRARALISPTR